MGLLIWTYYREHQSSYDKHKKKESERDFKAYLSGGWLIACVYLFPAISMFNCFDEEYYIAPTKTEQMFLHIVVSVSSVIIAVRSYRIGLKREWGSCFFGIAAVLSVLSLNHKQVIIMGRDIWGVIYWLMTFVFAYYGIFVETDTKMKVARKLRRRGGASLSAVLWNKIWEILDEIDNKTLYDLSSVKNALQVRVDNTEEDAVVKTMTSMNIEHFALSAVQHYLKERLCSGNFHTCRDVSGLQETQFLEVYKIVLNMLCEKGYISQDEREAALKETLADTKNVG